MLHIVKLKVIHLWACINYLAIHLEKWYKLVHGSFWICLNLETEKCPVTSFWVWPHWRHGPVAPCVLVREYMPRIEYSFCIEDSWEITARSLSKFKMCAILWFLKEGSRAPDCFWLCGGLKCRAVSTCESVLDQGFSTTCFSEPALSSWCWSLEIPFCKC